MCNCNIINSMCLMFPIYFVFSVAISTTRGEVQVQAFGVGRGWGRVSGRRRQHFQSAAAAKPATNVQGLEFFRGGQSKIKAEGDEWTGGEDEG